MRCAPSDLPEDFDITPYIRAPVIDAASGIGLTVAIITAAPKPLAPKVKSALNSVRSAAVDLQKVWSDRDRAGKPLDPRPADVAVDHAWSALYARLDAYGGLTTKSPNATRALQLRDSLFPGGLGWLTTDFESEWAESKKRIDRIDAEKLAPELDRLAGPEFLAEVHATHQAYGDAIGITKQAADPGAALIVPLRNLRRAIPAYAIQVVAATDMGNEAAVAALRAALRPIDSLRAAQAARAGSSTPAGTGTPQPPAPPAPSATPTTAIPPVQS